MRYQQYLEEVGKLVRHMFELAIVRMQIKSVDDKMRQVLEETAQKHCDSISREKQYMREAETYGLASDDFFPLAYLMKLMDCTPFERHIIYLLVGYELLPECPRICIRLTEGYSQQITKEIILLTFEDEVGINECYSTVARKSMMSRVFFAEPLGGSSAKDDLRLHLRMVDLIVTQNPYYSDYENLVQVVHGEEKQSPYEDTYGIVNKIKALLRAKRTKPIIFQIYGLEGAGKKSILEQIASEMNWEVVLWKMKSADNEMEQYRAWYRECKIWNGVPALGLLQEQLGEKMIEDMLLDYPFVFVLTQKKQAFRVSNAHVFSFALEEQSMHSLALCWEQESRKYQVDDTISASEMAGKFTLTPGQIRRVWQLAEAFRIMADEKLITKEMLHRGCYEILGSKMDDKAQRVDAMYQWDDIVLPSAQKEKLRIACNQVEYRQKVYEEWGMSTKISYGKGVSMLFAGSPGTGKTMAAQVVASELGMELYSIVLPTVVSKYVGETEKNLNDIFEQARKSQVILFFDEADVLFSKRTQVKDANDKFNNMEAAFLLQKMEAYEGVTILATNYLQNFDEAFMRRIKFVVDFPFPDEKCRRQIWERAIPKQLPTSELDFEFVARKFSLSGSNIKNIVLHAAFLAAAQGENIGMRQLLAAVKNEYAKLGKSLLPEEMGEYFMLL